MPSYRKHNPPPPAPPAPPLDLATYSEATRRRLYDLAAAIHFPPRPAVEDPDVYVPPYSPEEAGLLVLWTFGRWLCTWQPLEDLGEPFLPADRSWVVLRITADQQAPLGVRFHEV
jgi:hypothetical protein